jgi:hypothetical protein
MGSDARQLPAVSAFRHHLPRPVLYALTKALVDAYSLTFDQLKQYWTGKEAIALRPQIQRANTHAQFRGVCDRFGMPYEQVANQNKSDWHLEIRPGPITLLDAYIPSESDLPKYARFRELLAQNNQRWLFGDLPLVTLETKLTAFLVHGCNGVTAEERIKRTVPDFAEIRFLVDGCDEYASCGINLQREFASLFVVAGAGREEVRDRANVKIRHQQTGEAE